jgi:Mg-chelatase subunit ChlD
MPAPKLLSGLPKPLLFGLYGALGGLLGAVALGEPAWRLLKPPPPPPPQLPPPPPPQVAVTAPPAVRLYPGTENTFAVRVARARFDGPVQVRFAAPANGPTVAPVTVPAGASEAEARVTAGPNVAVGTYKVAVAAEGGGATADAATEVEVVAAPAPPPAVAVSVPPRLAVFTRGTGTFTAAVARRGYDGPLALTVGPLPAGVTASPKEVPAGATEVEVTLTAAADAAAGAAGVAVGVSAPNGAPAATTQTALTVARPPATPVDVMFVLDCSGSMEPFIDGVKDGIRDFVKEFEAKQLDGRLGLLAFRDRIFGQEPELLRFENRSPFTADTSLFAEKVSKLRCIGNNTVPESALDAAVEAAGQPFRQGATRVLLLITDAPPLVPDKETKTVAEAAGVLKDKKVDQLHVVVREEDRRVYAALQKGAAGKFFDLERVTKGGEKFATILPELSKAVASVVVAKPAPAEVAPPPAPAALPAAAAAAPKAPEAAPAPVVPPPPGVQAVQSGGQFAAGSEGRLTLAIGAWTGAIAGLVCLALLAGQHHYLRGTLPGVGGAAAGLLGGVVAGLVGGAAGQGLYLLAPDSAALATGFRVLGWALLGGLAGVGLSAFVPNMRWVHGLAGGVLGGAVGAGGYLAAEAVAGDLVGRVVGGLVVGFAIGVMVAAAEAAFRRAWLEVRYGARETVTVTLGPEPVKVGGDAKLCTVWARGAPDVALRFFVRDGQVVCDDAVMKREAVAADGFTKDVGTVTVVVRTGSGAPVAPPAPRPAPPRPKPPVADDDPLPVAAAPSRPAAVAPKPVAPAKPAAVAAPPRPAPKPAAASPDGCPECGRANAGRPGQRYCVVCDRTY